MSHEEAATSRPAREAPAARAAATSRVAPPSRLPVEAERARDLQARPVYMERDSMRDFERLTPFKGERSQWRTWSQKARCAARVAGVERVMTGKDPRPSDADDPEAVESGTIKIGACTPDW